MLIDYAGSPVVADGAGGRAPDARGLTRDAVTDPFRLFALLDGTQHTLLLYADAAATVEGVETVAAAAHQATHGLVDVYVIAHPDASVDSTDLPLIRDTEGDFARAYGSEAVVVRPDGYLGYAGPADAEALAAFFAHTFC